MSKLRGNLGPSPGKHRCHRTQLRVVSATVQVLTRYTSWVSSFTAQLLLAIAFFGGAAPSYAQSAEANNSAAVALAAASAAQSAASAAARSASAAASAATTATSAAAGPNASRVSKGNDAERVWVAPTWLFLYGLPILALACTLVTILWIKNALSASNWSLSDALSEEVMLPVSRTMEDTTTKSKVTAYEYDNDHKPVLMPQMRASSSRVIAFIGMVAIVFLYLGFGTLALFSFARTGRFPESMHDIVSFLVAGLTLFAPYAVNKFASLFQGVSAGK